jgi:DNA-directed RNA polymerase delta subunit
MCCSTVPCGAPPPPETLDFTPTPVWLTAGMQETPAQDRELTLLRLHKPGMERAAQQLMEMRKDPIAWQAYIDDINAVSGGPIEDNDFMNQLGRYYAELRKDPERLERETGEDMEWQLGVASFLKDEDWTS